MKLTNSEYALIALVLVMPMNAFNNVKFNIMSKEDTSIVIPGISLDECWKNCERRVSCGSINYERKLHLCYLNYPKQSHVMVVRVGMVFSMKIEQADRVRCGQMECFEGEACDLTSEQCNTEECETLQQIPGVDLHGNMIVLGSEIVLRCREGFIPTEDNPFSKEAVCELDGWHNVQLECIPLTCEGLANIGMLESKLYNAYDEGSQTIIQLYCDFTSGSKIGYSFLSHTTLNPSVNITPHYNLRDHVMIRFNRNGKQFESKIQVVQIYRDTYNISVFNSNHPDFSVSGVVTRPFLFIGFIPISIGNHYGLTKGYTCNGQNYSFKNADTNTNNFFIIFQSKGTNKDNEIFIPEICDGWKNCSSLVVPTSRYIPEQTLFKSYEIGMGGGACLVHNDDITIDGLAFGLPFEY